MRETWIDQTSKIVNSRYGEGFKCYRNTLVVDSDFGIGVTIGDDTCIVRCNVGNNVGFNRRSYINDSFIGAFSYSGSNTTINFTSIGKIFLLFEIMPYTLHQLSPHLPSPYSYSIVPLHRELRSVFR